MIGLKPDSLGAGLLCVLTAGAAGGMGWGIRGQYGHETGAMIAGLLVGLVLVLFFGSQSPSLWSTRAIAMGLLAIGFGGSMTYGQTIGLTQNAPLIGDDEAWRWGMLGLAIKGGIWIGFAGCFLGMGLGNERYRWHEMLLIMISLVLLRIFGVGLLNEPFDPANQVLPRIYFSADWKWEPGADLKPRREVWGGLLVALIGLMLYVGILRKDFLAFGMGAAGFLGGAIGFPAGQSLQSYHAWHPEAFREGIWVWLDPLMNWWNCMETTFGFIMGATLALGLWLQRDQISKEPSASPELPDWLDAGLIIAHCILLIVAEFVSPFVNQWYGDGLILAILPMVAIAGGRFSPFLVMLPVTALPIVAKTIRQLVYKEELWEETMGWTILGAIPMAVVTVLAVGLAWRTIRNNEPSSLILRISLFVATWLYFGLNFGFFHAPWPWEAWTSRTPNGLVYFACACLLSLFSVLPIRATHLRNF